MLDGIQPFLETGPEFVHIFCELGDLQINECQFVVKDLVRLDILKLDVISVFFRIIPVLIEHKVQNADRIDGLEFIVPLSTPGLLLNRECGVVDAAVFKKILFGLL